MHAGEINCHQRISIPDHEEERRRNGERQQLIDGEGMMTRKGVPTCDADGDLVLSKGQRAMQSITVWADEQLASGSQHRGLPGSCADASCIGYPILKALANSSRAA